MKVLGTYVVDDGAAGWCRLVWEGEPEPVELSGLGRGGLVGLLTAMREVGEGEEMRGGRGVREGGEMRRRELKYECMYMDAWTIQCTLTLVKMAFYGWFNNFN